MDSGWDPVVHCCDASLSGFGVVSRPLGSRVAGEIGRQCERWRFALEDSIAARESALGAAAQAALSPVTLHKVVEGLQKSVDARGRHGRRAVRSPVHPDSEVVQLVSTQSPGFPEVDPTLLEESDWQHVYGAAWQKPGNILRLEALAFQWTARHIMRKKESFGQKHLIITDNLPLCLSITKGRAQSVHLKPTLSYLAALSLLTGSAFAARWAPSELNPSDAASRAFDAGLVAPGSDEARAAAAAAAAAHTQLDSTGFVREDGWPHRKGASHREAAQAEGGRA